MCGLKTTEVTVRWGENAVQFRLFDTPLCHEVTQSIISGVTYPPVAFLTDVRTIVDIGANIGAASVYFACTHPQARVLSFEPDPTTFELLRRNLLGFTNAVPFNIGLFDRDCEMPLHISKEDPVTNSVAASALNTTDTVMVRLQDAGATLHQHRAELIDILKTDTEGCELAILHSLRAFLPRTRVIYLEYHDESDRIAIDQLLRHSHILAAAKLRHPHRGELCYVHYNAFPSRPQLDALRIIAPAGTATFESPLAATTTFPSTQPIQEPFAAAVVMPTVLRPSIKRAVDSAFAQDLAAPCQLLIGIDKAIGDRAVLEYITETKPPNWTVTIIDLQYSTSVRHGGIHAAQDGGALRTILSYGANSRYIAYLDDDNWWAPDHLSTLLAAIGEHDYAYTQRWFVDPHSLVPQAIDTWESVGRGAGIFQERFGGFIDPNTLMIDKLRCEPVLRCWVHPLLDDAKGMSADRQVFDVLNTQYAGCCTGRATCYYLMDPTDILHAQRLEMIGLANAGTGGAGNGHSG
jgi:FkbM family methyltransferase